MQKAACEALPEPLPPDEAGALVLLLELDAELVLDPPVDLLLLLHAVRETAAMTTGTMAKRTRIATPWSVLE
ncbi:MAG: hypothetical protein J0H43_12215 [Actinobacteria bacterium]|nr:hypothetical protein [Actinomycetota bacterium]